MASAFLRYSTWNPSNATELFQQWRLSRTFEGVDAKACDRGIASQLPAFPPFPAFSWVTSPREAWSIQGEITSVHVQMARLALTQAGGVNQSCSSFLLNHANHGEANSKFVFDDSKMTLTSLCSSKHDFPTIKSDLPIGFLRPLIAPTKLHRCQPFKVCNSSSEVTYHYDGFSFTRAIPYFQ